ncbi:unnamed protein product [Cyprideis torosa]|uniref:Uncharacterized protein n=1 Tax=Cyprideis torosa TaxID=163714 RepID=A0A7R8W3J3_9CRUS|nr:unnamed protein product [Cyprideis torosa]CAG0883038.1 unnamed protein product [Cyprideis torosa]
MSVSDGDGEATSLSSCSDIHVVAGLLKLFLRLLPIPLIPFDQYDRLIAAMKCTSPLQRIGEVRTILARFPPAHFQTTKFLMAHLYRVSCESARNKMTPKALATVFAPTTMRRATLNVPPPSPSPSSSAPPSPAVPHNLADPLSLLTLMDAEKEVIEFLIEREPEVFS